MRAAAKARRAKQRALPEESAYEKAFEKSAGKEGRLEKKCVEKNGLNKRV